MSQENETLRWPINLDHAAIVQRLVEIRESARATGLEEVAALFAEVETMPAGQIGASVIAALNWLQEKPEHLPLAEQLGMIAVNLKNLRS